MKKLRVLLSISAVLVTTSVLSGCLSNVSADQALDMGIKGAQALSLTDAQVKALTTDACNSSDKSNRIAGASTKYGKRLAKIAAGLPKTINGSPASYKVYMTKDVNAWAMANGCIRVYSGLMDLMDDNEVRGVLGHEVGHVAKGHTKKAIQLAMMASVGKDALASSSNGTVAALTRTQLGDFTEKLINAQFSQQQEREADDYAYQLLVASQHDPQALVTSFKKLASLNPGRTNSILSSHPDPLGRAARIEKQIIKDAKKKK